jgi:hypothetical protein
VGKDLASLLEARLRRFGRLVRHGKGDCSYLLTGYFGSPSDWCANRAALRSADAANILRRQGFAPVYAQRLSDFSTKETGLCVVGTRLMKPDELAELASKYECSR